MSTLLQDLKYGLRTLGRSPGFTAIAIITLALGIGANTAIFSIVDGLLLRGLAVPNSGQLVSLAFWRGKGDTVGVFSYPDLKDVGKQMHGSMEVLAYRFGIDGLSHGVQADHVITNYVSGSYFSVMGVKPAIGRLILPSEGDPSRADPILVLGYSYWKSRFGSDPNVVGKQVRVDGQPLTVIGVTPKDFQGALEDVDIQAFMPLNMYRVESDFAYNSRAARGLFALGRLKNGTSLRQVQAALNVVAARLGQQYPTTDSRAHINVYPEADAALTPMPEPGMHQKEVAVMGLFLALAGFVLLLACFNIANIMLVRATSREHEMTIRAALGAPKYRLIRQPLTESLLLALFGCGAGILVGLWAIPALRSIHISMGLPLHMNFSLDWKVLAYSVAAALVAATVVGVMPALRAARTNPGAALHEATRTASGRHFWIRNVVVVAQVAGSIVLLTVAGLFTRSLFSAQRMDLGFNPGHLTNFHMDPHEIGYNDAQWREFYKNLLTRVRDLPGVQSAALAYTYPSNGVYENFDSIYVEGYVLPKGQPAPIIAENAVTPGYFKTLRIPIVEGRAFEETDTDKSQSVAVINQTMARQFWPGEDPVGRVFRTGNPTGTPLRVVGIARDSKYGDLFAKATPYLYRPLSQDSIPIETLQVRSLVPPAMLEREVERQIHDLAPGLPIFDVQTMRQALDGSGFYDYRLGAYMASALGVLALILATVGVYGVISFSTSQRTREIGIRMALGAQPRDIWKAVFRQGIVIVAVGAGAGILAAFGLTRVMASLLYGISAHDPLTYLGAVFLIAAITLFACYVPARRATKVDPVVALRYE